MSQALYRKYRSKNLAQLVGQEHITETLTRALAANKIGHAYLFTGPRGTGKTSVARILAYEINKLPYTDTPHLDIIEIDAASNRRIDDIRDLREKVHIAPIQAKYKVYIIDEAHMLTTESFNALLKTLEEPPAHVVFMLATTEAHKLPATIISRTQRFSFRPVEPAKVIAHLQSIADKEGIKIDDAALGLVAEHGEGSFRDSISLLDQLAHVSNDSITADDVQRILGLAPAAHIEALLQAITKGKQSDIAATLQQLEAAGTTPSALVSQLTKALLTKAAETPRLYSLIDQLLEVPRAYHPGLKLLTVLMLFAAPTDKPRTVPTTATTPSISIEAPIIKKQIVTERATAGTAGFTPPTPDSPPGPTTTVTAQLESLSNQEWHAVLAAVKKASPPLFSVLKHAQPVLADQKLTLKCRFNLHRKKLDDVKQKALLTQIMQGTLGGSLPITTVIDATATPPPATSDPVVESVAKIMGGGQMIDPPAA